MPIKTPACRMVVRLAAIAVAGLAATSAMAQRVRPNDAYQPPADQAGLGTLGPDGTAAGAGGAPGTGGYGQNTYGQPQTYGNPAPAYGGQGGSGPAYGQSAGQPYGQGQTYGGPVSPPPPAGQSYGTRGYAANGEDTYRAPREEGFGQPYSPPPAADQGPPRYERGDDHGGRGPGTYSEGEIVDKGKGFFGAISQGLASAIEYTYREAGRPNGYILGEDGGGAFFAGLRYGQGTLYTKDAGDHRVYWQGPSFGYDLGGEGSKVMVLVYNLSQPGDVYHRFGGVEGSAYLVGGVSVQFQKHDDVTLALIRSGVGLRLGANVGYLKYTREPTVNPF